MVVMADYGDQEYIYELGKELDELHERYLTIEDEVLQNKERQKLEICIEKYLSFVEHNQKFVHRETAEIIRRATNDDPNFNFGKASIAFNAIAKYAANIISEPWRQEFRKIKLYSGYYIHQIQSNLPGVISMLELMGYKKLFDNDILILESSPIISLENFMTVSKDSLIAYVELKIMQEIIDILSKNKRYREPSCQEVLKIRESFICPPQQALDILKQRLNGTIDNLTHQMPSKQEYISQDMSSNITSQPNFYSPPSYYLPPPYPIRPTIPIDIDHYRASYTCLPSQTYQQVVQHSKVLPATNYALSYQSPNINRCNGYNGYHGDPTPYSNGYQNNYNNHISCVPPPYIIQTTFAGNCQPMPAVPTAQLIELDQTPTHSDSISSQQDDHRRREQHSGTIENWDYVYKKLETQGYNKDQSQRGDLLQNTALNNMMRNMRLESKRAQSSSFDDLASLSENCAYESEKTKSLPRSVKKGSQKSPVKKHEAKTLKIGEKTKSNSTKVLSQTLKIKRDKWQCKHCTFDNAIIKNVCDMCSKSRDENVINIEPDKIGGAQCSHCTYVNKKNVKECEICSLPLKNASTYI